MKNDELKSKGTLKKDCQCLPICCDDCLKVRTDSPFIMADGIKAWLTDSREYYCRREPDSIKWKKIVYYDLKKKHILLAKGKCGKCGEMIESQHCGDFVSCKCGASYLDTDRWQPERHRFGGEAKPIN